MNFKQLTLLKVSEEVEAATGYVVRVFAAIEEEAPDSVPPLTAELGGQPVEGLGIVQGLVPMLSGYMKTQPQPGDELVIKIGNVEIPTGLTVGNPPIA